MNLAYQKLVEHLDEREISYIANTDDQSISTNIAGEVGNYRICVQVPDASDVLQLSGASPMRVPCGARPAIAEAITRANHNLRIGKLTLDFDTGELKFHMGQLFTDVGPDAEIIDWMICTTLAVMDKYLPAILSVIYGDEAPADAVRRVEAGCGGNTTIE